MLCFCSRRPCPPDPPPPHLWRLCPGMLFAAPLISHVIPLCLIQTLNLHRWNCNVFGTSRKMTTINYVRNVGAVVSSQPTGAASGPRRPRAPQLGPPAPPGPSTLVATVSWHVVRRPPNFARNSALPHSNIEFASLELQRFWDISKNDHDKLRAKCGGGSVVAAHGCRVRAPPPPTGTAARPFGPSGALHIGDGGGFAALGGGWRRVAGVSGF